jgi:PilZ domain
VRNVERDMTSDRRLTPRRNGGPAVVEVDSGMRTAGEVVDQSPGGLALAVKTRSAVGDRLRVRPAAEPDAPWAEVEVRHGRPGAGGWLLGCRYATVASPGVIAALARSCLVLRLPALMPPWFRAFAAGRLTDLCPDAVETVRAMAEADLRRLYAAVSAVSG